MAAGGPDGDATVRLLVCVDHPHLLERVQHLVDDGSECSIVQIVPSLDAALASPFLGSVDVLVVDGDLCRRGIEIELAPVAARRMPMVILTSRDTLPSVVRFERSHQVRAVRLPKWVLDRSDDLTAAHTRALFCDLSDRVPPRSKTGEMPSPSDLSTGRRVKENRTR